MLLNNLYTIQAIETAEAAVSATVLLDKGHDIFQGHFPGNPVLPGVCLMTIVKEVLEQGLGKTMILQEAKQVKFLGVINPEVDDRLTVHCTFEKQPGGSLKTTSTIHAGERVCYKASAVYKTLLV